MSENQRKYFCMIFGCISSLIIILLVFSPQNVDPLNIDWVTNGGGDNLQHYLGWRHFRNSTWNRYLLFMKNLNFPIGTSVIVTDSNPLFCLIFKLLKNLIPERFQFNGIWITLSYLLIGCFSSLIGWKITKKISLTIVSVIISILNPVVLQRALIHDSLTAHWLILAAIYLMLFEGTRWNFVGWALLTFLTLLIHVYFIPMIAFVLILQTIRMMIKKRSALLIIVSLAAFVVPLCVGYFILGYSHILPQSGSYGELSMNLNAFINPDSIPSLLFPRPIQPLQYEGFNYLGLGLIVLIIFGMVIGRKELAIQSTPYMLPVIGLILFAVSNEGYFDKHLIYRVELPERLYSSLSILRSSGRLVWPLYYLFLFVVIYVFAKVINTAAGKRKMLIELLPLLCIIIQIVDLHGFLLQAAERFRNPTNVLPELSEEFVSAIPVHTKHLYCSDGDSKIVDAMSLFAADNHMTFNRSSNAREIEHIYGGDMLEMDKLNCQQIQPESVYVYINGVNFPNGIESCENVVIDEADNYIFISKDK
ncbi:MAG: hypothetical protein IJI41_11955 [Anaerolineaceae bacterium]|nr:hypothetical protein [Anaerolineaceae bacterium]